MQQKVKNKWFKYYPALREKARQLRKQGTYGEVLLWRKLKNKQVCGYRFNRQVPIDRYIVDFYCKELQLAIEIDGRSHENKNYDDFIRQRRLESFGIRFLRFSEIEVRLDLERVLRTIEVWIEKNIEK